MSPEAGPELSGIKPAITADQVLPLLQEYLGAPIRDLAVVEGGQVAQTFSFAVDARRYIVRFNAPMLVNFEKDAYVYAHFCGPRIPIPRVVHIGRLGNIPYAISERAPGRNLLEISRADYLALIPEMVAVLDAIHEIRVDDKPGYGIFDGRGAAPMPGWPAFLLSINQEEPETDFYGKWHTLFHDSFLDRDLFERLYGRMAELARYCPEERSLVHGGYGFGNVLAQDGHISAVLDWVDAKYGDFLYDVAWLDFWSPEDGWCDRFRQHYGRLGRTVPSYAERIACCQCYMALDGMRFFAKGGSRSGYDWVCKRVISMLL